MKYILIRVTTINNKHLTRYNDILQPSRIRTSLASCRLRSAAYRYVRSLLRFWLLYVMACFGQQATPHSATIVSALRSTYGIGSAAPARVARLTKGWTLHYNNNILYYI